MKTPAQELGEAIAKDREKMQIPQGNVASAVGVSQQAYSGWEAGTSLPRPARLKRLVDYFGEESNTAKAMPQVISAYALDHLRNIDVHLIGLDGDAGRHVLTQIKEARVASHTVDRDLELVEAHFSGTHAPSKRKMNIGRNRKTGDQTGAGSPPPPMDSDDVQAHQAYQVRQESAQYGIKSFEQQPPTDIREALSRAANGVALARQVLDDASVQLERAMQQLQKA